MTKAAADKQKWYAIEVTVEPAATEAIEYAFNSLESLGTEIDQMRTGGNVEETVVGYFNELPADEILQDEIHYALKIYGMDDGALKRFGRREVENQDWLKEWKKHWKPTEIGRFIVAPPWEEVDELGRILIRIEPNMAFGTGTHETTQLCLKAIEHNFRAGESFLDVGTGTGILAIAAAKWATEHTTINTGRETLASSASLIFACDTDVDSIKIARENAVLNRVAELIEFSEGPLPKDAPVFDFVCANLTIDVILPILSVLLEKTRKTLVLSGILQEQKADVMSALKEFGITDPGIAREGEWFAVLINKGPRR